MVKIVSNDPVARAKCQLCSWDLQLFESETNIDDANDLIDRRTTKKLMIKTLFLARS